MSMAKEAKKYMRAVTKVLMLKYGLTEIEAHKAIRSTFLYDSLLYHAEETIHDDVETNAEFVYQDYKNPVLMRM